MNKIEKRVKDAIKNLADMAIECPCMEELSCNHCMNMSLEELIGDNGWTIKGCHEKCRCKGSMLVAKWPSLRRPCPSWNFHTALPQDRECKKCDDKGYNPADVKDVDGIALIERAFELRSSKVLYLGFEGLLRGISFYSKTCLDRIDTGNFKYDVILALDEVQNEIQS